METAFVDAFRHLGNTCTPDSIARCIGRDHEAVLDQLAALEDAGSVTTWVSDSGVVVSLTPRGADAIGLVLDDPAQVAVDAGLERSSKRDWAGSLRCDFSGHPYPNILLEGKLWDNIEHETCPTCLGRPLRPSEYCLRCDAWGLSPRRNDRS